VTRRPIRVTIDFGGLDPSDNEFGSIEDFVEFLVDDDQEEFDWRHLNCLGSRLGRSNRSIRKELEGMGFTLADRVPEAKVRGFHANPHDRWYGPGSCPSHGGSGWAQIIGQAD